MLGSWVYVPYTKKVKSDKEWIEEFMEKESTWK